MIFKNIYLEILRFFFKDTFSAFKILCLAKDIYDRYILVLFFKWQIRRIWNVATLCYVNKSENMLVYILQKINDKRLLVIIKAVLGFQHM